MELTLKKCQKLLKGNILNKMLIIMKIRQFNLSYKKKKKKVISNHNMKNTKK